MSDQVDAPESSGVPPVQPETIPTTPPESTPATGGNPWDADLATAMANAEDPVAAASAFIGSNIQPRVTQLEQDLAKVPAEAIDLFNDLRNEPEGTVNEIMNAYYGPEVAETMRKALEAQNDPDTPPVDPQVDAQPTTKVEFEDLPPEVQEAVTRDREAKEKKEYDAFLTDLKALPGRENLDDAQFSKHLYLTEGNVEQALANMDAEQAKYEKNFREKYNLPEDAEVPPPPAAINADTQTPITPEPPKQYTKWDQLDDAFDDMQAESRPAAPPTVGVV